MRACRSACARTGHHPVERSVPQWRGDRVGRSTGNHGGPRLFGDGLTQPGSADRAVLPRLPNLETHVQVTSNEIATGCSITFDFKSDQAISRSPISAGRAFASRDLVQLAGACRCVARQRNMPPPLPNPTTPSRDKSSPGPTCERPSADKHARAIYRPPHDADELA
jgi:hypothetical protein